MDLKYRKFGRVDFNASVLGFGCMRFPVFDNDPAKIDQDEVNRMIHYAIDHGVNYFDSAYVYHAGKSEEALGKALKGGYREKVKITSKMPTWMVKERADYMRFLDESIKHLDTDYIDMYLIHSLDKERLALMEKTDGFSAIDEYKKSGKAKSVGFSFHDDLETFKRIVDRYDWDFCQIQLNYMDDHYQAGVEGLEYAASKGLAVIVMEPLRGGKLAKTPAAPVQKVWDQADVKRSPVEWALRWVWNHPQVTLLLSGMSTFEQVVDNVRLADEAEANSLTEKELALIAEAKKTYGSLAKVNCTACEYCMPCPFGVNIPGNFTFYNEAFIYDDLEGRKEDYNRWMEPESRADKCRQCGKCEKLCPQKIEIRKRLKEVAATFAE